ncbi:uncharacterized protein LOC135943775 [Cloeon dipterum]|uniref:uncharacterized protein LOC135943775 n=1 Tax=Cloeon dipterum TaxID=197152 RepID=UPI00321F7B3C
MDKDSDFEDRRMNNSRKRQMADSPASDEAEEKIPRVEFEPTTKSVIAEKLESVKSNRGGIPAILYAAEFACFEECQALVKQGEDVNVTDKIGNDVYHYAFNSQPLDLLKFAFEQDPSVVKVKERDEYDQEIAWEAAMNLNFESFMWILEMAGSLVESKEWRLEIIKHAAANDNEEDGEAIANHVFNSFANDYDKEDLTCVLTEVMPWGKLKVVQMLVDRGADLKAVEENELEAAKFVYQKNPEEITSRMLICAAEKRNVEMCEWLVGLLEEQGRKQPVDQSPESNEKKEKIPRGEFDPKVPLAEKLAYVKSNRGDIPAILYAAEFACFEVCQELVKQGEDVNVTDKIGNDVYHYACKNKTCDLELIDLFANNGADIERLNENQDDAVMDALQQGNVKFAVKLFGLYGTERSLLWYCIPSQTTNMLKLAYDQDPSVVKVKNSDGFDKEILKQAALFKDFETFELVLQIERDFSGDLLKSKEFREDILKKAAINDNEEASVKITDFIFSFANDFEQKDFTRLLTDIMPGAKLKVVQMLVDRGADLKVRMWREGISYSLFEKAVEENELEAAKFAYEKNPEEITSRMLICAAEKRNVEMCEWLVGLLEAPFIEILIPAFMYFIARYKPFGDEIIPQSAPKLRSYINQVDREGKTALHLAVDQHNLGALGALLEIGADIEVQYQFYNLLIYCLKKTFLEGAKIVYAKDRSQLRGCDAKMASAFSKDRVETENWLNSLRATTNSN